MDLNRQAEAMMRLLAADFSEETDLFWNTSVGKDSFLHSAWLWDGVLLWANEIRMTELSYTGNLYGRKDYLLLNICHAGRCEVELSSGRYVYMSPGTLNVSCSPPGSSYHYPGGAYQGIELCFDIQKMGMQIPGAAVFAVFTEHVAEPPLIARAAAPAMILHSFPEGRALTVIFFVVVGGYLEPLFQVPVVDTMGLVVADFHKDFLRSICVEWRKPHSQLPDGNTKLTAVLMEISPFRIAAIPAQRAAVGIQLSAQYSELLLIR